MKGMGMLVVSLRDVNFRCSEKRSVCAVKNVRVYVLHKDEIKNNKYGYCMPIFSFMLYRCTIL